MTAPALPGAAPDPAPGRNDPARLPPEVESHVVAVDALLDAVRKFVKKDTPTGLMRLNDAMVAARDSTAALRTAIARALGGDGEPVAWAMCHVPFGHDDTAAKPKLLFDTKDRAEDVARRQSAFGVGTGARFIVRPMTWADAPSRRAATGDTGEGGAK